MPDEQAADLAPHDWAHDGRITRFTWLGRAEQEALAARVYAIGFTGDGRILLVGSGAGADFWGLPAALSRTVSRKKTRFDVS